jgi:hypothetical protein
MCRIAPGCAALRRVSWLRCVILHLGVLSFLSHDGRNPDAGVAAQAMGMGGHAMAIHRATRM